MSGASSPGQNQKRSYPLKVEEAIIKFDYQRILSTHTIQVKLSELSNYPFMHKIALAAKGTLASTQVFWGSANLCSALPSAFFFSEDFCTAKVILGAAEIGLGLNSLLYTYDQLCYPEPTLEDRDFVIFLNT